MKKILSKLSVGIEYSLYLILVTIGIISINFAWSAAQEVITLDEASSQLEAPQTGDTYTMPRSVLMTGETITSSGTTDTSLSVAQTLNDSGAAGGSDLYTGIFLDVTQTDVTGWDTVNLLDLQVGSVSQFEVADTGTLTIGKDATMSGVIILSGNPSYVRLGREGIGASDDYFELRATNSAGIIAYEGIANDPSISFLANGIAIGSRDGSGAIDVALANIPSSELTLSLKADLNITDRDRDGSNMILSGGAGGATNRTGGDIDIIGGTATGTGKIGIVTINKGLEVTTSGANFGYMQPATTGHTMPTNVFEYTDEFMQQTWVDTDGPWIFNNGIDAEAVDGVIVASAERGQLTLVAGDADGACANDCSQMVWKNPIQADSGALVMEVKLHLDATTAISVNIGFTDITTLQEAASVSGTTITTTAVDFVGFVYDTAATTDEWYAIGVDGNTDMVGAALTGIAPSAGTFQIFRLEVDSTGETCRFYINGVLEISGTATCVAASTNIFPYISVNSTTTTVQAVDIEYIYVGHTR